MVMIDLDNTTDDNSGFLLAADSGKTPWDRANIRLYNLWEIADHDAEVVPCARNSEDASVDDVDPCPNEAGVGVDTGGYKQIFVYSDNHGEAQAIINGGADLDFQGCMSSADNATAPHDVAGDADIKQIKGFFCDLGDV